MDSDWLNEPAATVDSIFSHQPVLNQTFLISRCHYLLYPPGISGDESPGGGFKEFLFSSLLGESIKLSNMFQMG